MVKIYQIFEIFSTPTRLWITYMYHVVMMFMKSLTCIVKFKAPGSGFQSRRGQYGNIVQMYWFNHIVLYYHSLGDNVLLFCSQCPYVKLWNSLTRPWSRRMLRVYYWRGGGGGDKYDHILYLYFYLGWLLCVIHKQLTLSWKLFGKLSLGNIEINMCSFLGNSF